MPGSTDPRERFADTFRHGLLRDAQGGGDFSLGHAGDAVLEQQGAVGGVELAKARIEEGESFRVRGVEISILGRGQAGALHFA